MSEHYQPISIKGVDDNGGTTPCEATWDIPKVAKITKVTINHERAVIEFSPETHTQNCDVPLNDSERVVITQMDGPHLTGPPLLISATAGTPPKVNVLGFAPDNRMSKIDIVAGKVTCYGTWPIPVELELNENVTIIAEFS